MGDPSCRPSGAALFWRPARRARPARRGPVLAAALALWLCGAWWPGRAAPSRPEIHGELVLQHVAQLGRPTRSGPTSPYLSLSARLPLHRPFTVTAAGWLTQDGQWRAHLDALALHWEPFASGAVRLSLGRQPLPFGHFDTRLVSPPLTLDLGALRSDHAVTLTLRHAATELTLAGFADSAAPAAPGVLPHSGHGLRLQHQIARDTLRLTLGWDYLSNVSAAAAFEADPPPGPLAAHGLFLQLDADGLWLTAEHLALLDPYRPTDDSGQAIAAVRPAATQVEWQIPVTARDALLGAIGRTHGGEWLWLPRQSVALGWQHELGKRGVLRCDLSWQTDGEGWSQRLLSLQWSLPLW